MSEKIKPQHQQRLAAVCNKRWNVSSRSSKLAAA